MFNKLLLTTLLLSAAASAESISVDMTDLYLGEKVGTISIEQNQYGVVFTPNITEISTGLHGFHIHENPSCDSFVSNSDMILGGAAGGHYDPMKTGKHGFPWSDNNHLGDLPPLYANADGQAVQPVLAPRIKLSDLSGRSLMIHTNGDNHSDHPEKLGGGGARLICGVIK